MGMDSSSLGRSAVLVLKGICMGAADIVPGVSGGTVAFITGIYDQLIDAIRSFDSVFLGKVLRLDFSGAVRTAHFSFLLPLLLGIGIALLSMARVMHFLLDNHPVLTWALFFGLIAGSILVVGRRIGRFTPTNIACLITGMLSSYFIVGMIPIATPETFPFLFLCGMIAISAMILPGLSGAFLLLILGKYQFVTGALKNPFIAQNLLIIGVFGSGCLVGVVLFSRVLYFLLQRYHAATISLLTGFMIGAMRKIWPWKVVLQTEVIRGKTYVVATQNIFPQAVDSSLFFALGAMVVGFVVVLLLDQLSSRG